MKSLRNVAVHLVASCRTRAELFAVEFQEERYRLIELLLMAGAALMLGSLALLLLSFTLILLFPVGQRIYVALALVLFYGAAAILLVMRVKRRLQDEAFSETVNQLKKDWECLTPPE
ncbi:MAG TPA: phage holin family protein [Candidatus Limnocylindrales bacterium]|nr:phage holin family protein [Candidatus Limnocylindrales bacterium]